MKSLQIHSLGKQTIPDPENYSDLQVMQSAAGFYLGTIYNNPEGFQEPGSRDSTYFRTKEDAEFALARLEELYKEEEDINFEWTFIDLWEMEMMQKFNHRVDYRLWP